MHCTEFAERISKKIKSWNDGKLLKTGSVDGVQGASGHELSVILRRMCSCS